MRSQVRAESLTLRPGRRLGGVYNASNNWQETTARPRATCCAARVVFPSAADLVGSRVTFLFYFLSLCVVMIYVCLFDILTSSEFRILISVLSGEILLSLLFSILHPRFASYRSGKEAEKLESLVVPLRFLPILPTQWQVGSGNHLLLPPRLGILMMISVFIGAASNKCCLYTFWQLSATLDGHVVYIYRW